MDKKDHFTFRIDPDLREKLRDVASAQERTMGWLIRYYLRLGLGLPTPPGGLNGPASGTEAKEAR